VKNPHPPHLGDLLLASGAVEGPCRRTYPIRLSLWSRIVRALRARRNPKGPKP
jgi:hypothetical protein